MDTDFHCRGNGKLLLSGEYFVLDGANSLAIPLRLGQSIDIREIKDRKIHWTSIDHLGHPWFDAIIDIEKLNIKDTSDKAVAIQLLAFLKEARTINPQFLSANHGWEVETRLDFPGDWGLGSSSTLIYVISQWAKVDPFKLLFKTMGGSGYDIACAAARKPIFYQNNNESIVWDEVDFNPSFKNALFFVYLGKKQNSRDGIKHYKQKFTGKSGIHEEISDLSKQILSANSIKNFENLLVKHELLVAEKLDLERAQDIYFSDYWGVVKSLGAWGGDFVLVTSDRSFDETQTYFNKKGFNVFFRYSEMVL